MRSFAPRRFTGAGRPGRSEGQGLNAWGPAQHPAGASKTDARRAAGARRLSACVSAARGIAQARGACGIQSIRHGLKAAARPTDPSGANREVLAARRFGVGPSASLATERPPRLWRNYSTRYNKYLTRRKWPAYSYFERDDQPGLSRRHSPETAAFSGADVKAARRLLREREPMGGRTFRAGRPDSRHLPCARSGASGRQFAVSNP